MGLAKVESMLQILFLICTAAGQDRPSVSSFQVVSELPHDPFAFTEGLEFRGGFLYESGFFTDSSRLRRLRPDMGTIEGEVALPARVFGEGVTVIGDRIVQVTLTSHIGYVYDRRTLALLSSFAYQGQGWGLANDGTEIYMSDGTSQIRCLDPSTFVERRRFAVHDGATEITSLNELEFVRDELFANVLPTDRIVRFSPKDGRVLGWIDLSGLLSAEREGGRRVGPLNGIAYDATADRLFVTGKLWPVTFEIKLVGDTAR